MVERFYQLPDTAFEDPRLSEGVLLKCLMLVLRLSVRDGYCFATNAYFASLLGIQPESASRLLSKLSAYGYLRLETSPNQGRTQRHIYPLHPCAKHQAPLTETSSSIDPNVNEHCAERQPPLNRNVNPPLTETSTTIKQEELDKKELKNISSPLTAVRGGKENLSSSAKRISSPSRRKKSDHDPLVAAQKPMLEIYEAWAKKNGKVPRYSGKVWKDFHETRQYIQSWLESNPSLRQGEGQTEQLCSVWQKIFDRWNPINQYERDRFQLVDICNDLHKLLERLKQQTPNITPKKEEGMMMNGEWWDAERLTEYRYQRDCLYAEAYGDPIPVKPAV